MGALSILEGINVRHEMASDAKCVDEFLDAGGFVDHIRSVDSDVLSPVDGHVGNAKRRKDFFKESIAANQKLMNLGEVFPGPSPLDHTVVIGGGEGDGLTNTQICKRAFRGPLEFCGVVQSASPNDAGLAFHQPGDRVNCSDTARVGQRDGISGVVICDEFAFSGPGDNIFVGEEGSPQTPMF